jgi:hypothetical protein
LTYGIHFTCIGDLVVKVATLGRAELEDLYATKRTPLVGQRPNLNSGRCPLFMFMHRSA